MNVWIIVFFNLLILTTWVYLLYLVYTLDPKIRASWNNNTPSWADEYSSFITSVKVTSFINGSIVFLTIPLSLYKEYSTPYVAIAGRRR